MKQTKTKRVVGDYVSPRKEQKRLNSCRLHRLRSGIEMDIAVHIYSTEANEDSVCENCWPADCALRPEDLIVLTAPRARVPFV